MIQFAATIKRNERIADRIYQLVIEGKNQEIPKPGQFYYIRINDTTDPLLRRPISVQDYDEETKQISMIYRIEGTGTTRLKIKKTEELLDVVGPLGHGFPTETLTPDSRILLIGGGIGIPPLYYLGKDLVNKGFRFTALLGFQSKSDSFLKDDFSKIGETRVASIDGSIGKKGTVLDLIQPEEKWDTFYAVGPSGMLKAIQQKWADTELNGYVSLEERMGCGLGACYGCIVKVDPTIDKRGYKKVCSDGPVFSFREVIL